MGRLRKEEYIRRYGEDAWKDYSKKRKEENKLYREDNQNIIKKLRDNYENTPYGRATHLVRRYRQGDKECGYNTDITAQWVVDNIFSQSCIYCGDNDWKQLGCDRIDSTKGHTMDNIVCACRICNGTRRSAYTIEEFKEYRKTHPRKCDIPS